MLWVIYALVHSFFRAAFTETNRLFRQDAWLMTFWQSVVASVIMVPLIPLMNWPLEGRVYFAAFVVAMIMTVGVLIQLNLAAQKKGRVSSIYMPLEAVAAFLIWVSITTEAYTLLSHDMIMTGMVIAAFIVATMGAARIRPQDFSLATFSVVAPVGITYAVAGVVTKMVVPTADLLPSVLTYVFFNFVLMSVVIGVIVLCRGEATPKLFDHKLLKAGTLAGAFTVVSHVTFVAAIVLSPNPGYVSLIAMLLPVWLLFLHRAARVEDHARSGAALMLVFGVALLVLASWIPTVAG
jgi:hypothetical protein